METSDVPLYPTVHTAGYTVTQETSIVCLRKGESEEEGDGRMPRSPPYLAS
jgi:hypothetical protein